MNDYNKDWLHSRREMLKLIRCDIQAVQRTEDEQTIILKESIEKNPRQSELDMLSEALEVRDDLVRCDSHLEDTIDLLKDLTGERSREKKVTITLSDNDANRLVAHALKSLPGDLAMNIIGQIDCAQGHQDKEGGSK